MTFNLYAGSPCIATSKSESCGRRSKCAHAMVTWALPILGTRPAPKTTADYLREALSSPFDAGSIRVRIEPHYGASAPDPKTKRRSSILHTNLLVDGRDLRPASTDAAERRNSSTVLRF